MRFVWSAVIVKYTGVKKHTLTIISFMKSRLMMVTAHHNTDD